VPGEAEFPWLDIAPEVQSALQDGRPVVALESTIICHGMPYPANVETALQVEAMVREHDATPATIAILNGCISVGLNEQQINYLSEKGKNVIKTSRRDIPFIAARRLDGATTVSATMIIAEIAGIRVFATGGIGGVHRGVETTFDVSADLQELAHTDVAVVCAGIKSVLDIGRTLEYLETLGVPVVGFQTDTLPAFYTQDSGYPVDYRIDNVTDAALAMKTKWDMGIDGGLVIANPVPEEHALDPAEIDDVIDEAIQQMKRDGISGKETTPFLLSTIADKTGGRSLDTNIQLVLNNAKLAAQIAVAYAMSPGTADEKSYTPRDE
jgi:pseudouridine-5'-phosphate glycosidase